MLSACSRSAKLHLRDATVDPKRRCFLRGVNLLRDLCVSFSLSMHLSNYQGMAINVLPNQTFATAEQGTKLCYMWSWIEPTTGPSLPLPFWKLLNWCWWSIQIFHPHPFFSQPTTGSSHFRVFTFFLRALYFSFPHIISSKTKVSILSKRMSREGKGEVAYKWAHGH